MSGSDPESRWHEVSDDDLGSQDRITQRAWRQRAEPIGGRRLPPRALRVVTSMLVIIAVVGGVRALISSGGRGGHADNARRDARSYITGNLGIEADHVTAYVAVVEIDIGPHTSIDKVAQDAQQAHDHLDAVRDDFATADDSGDLGKAETEVFTAANDLKNAMGALVAYTGDPNPATLAQFTTQYQTAKGEWNDGVKTIWRIARRKGAPTI